MNILENIFDDLAPLAVLIAFILFVASGFMKISMSELVEKIKEKLTPNDGGGESE